MRTRLEVIGVGDLDMYDDIPMSLNYSIADIAAPDKRKASFSKTITLPGTKNNNTIFGQLFEVDIYSTFNPNLKTDVLLLVDGVEVLRGILRIASITNTEDKIDYNVTVIGSIGNIYSAMGDDFLTDLDLSAFDHTLNKTNIVNSWSAAVGSGYVYPMIDYGYNNGVNWKVSDFYPAIYLKEYVDAIFTAAGYSYSSDFFSSTTFKSLIIPYSGGTLRLSESTITANNFSVNHNTTQAISNTVWTDIAFNTTVSDPNSVWNSTYASPVISSDYKFTATLYIDASTLNINTLETRVVYYPPGGVSPRILYASKRPGVQAGRTSTEVKYLFPTIPANIQSGGSVFFQMKGGGGFNLNADSALTGLIFNKDVSEGETVDINNAIPAKIKQKDLFSSIIKMFNLYVNVDSLNERNLLIEPRDDFYAAGSIEDWTNKLDLSRGLEIKPMGDINANRYIYSYKADRDYYNKDYQDAYFENYGTRTIETINDFVKGVKKTDVIFSATPLVEDESNGRVISSISNTSISTLTNTHPINNIRILYYGGLITQGKDWTLIEDSGTKTKYGAYPYGGHLDNPYTPTFDLCFGTPKQVYYSTDVYTSGNLFNKYHKNFYEDIVDTNSKLVTGYFKLSPIDIYKLDFRDELHIDGHLLRLINVEDYDSVISGLTKCEFLKVRVKPPFTAGSTSSVGGLNVPILGSDLYQPPAVTR